MNATFELRSPERTPDEEESEWTTKMKKLLFASVALALVSTGAEAQSYRKATP
jgi:hypothetical protein